MDKRGLFGIDSSAFSLKGEKIMYRDHTKVVQIGDKNRRCRGNCASDSGT